MKKIGLSVIYIGIGTILLHGTQRFYGQWADELSLIFFCFSVIQRLNIRIKNFFLYIIYIIYFTFYKYWCCFVFLFVLLVYYLFYLLKYKNKTRKKMVQITQNIFIASFVLWLLDHVMCLTSGNYYLHAMWHVGSAMGICHGATCLL